MADVSKINLYGTDYTIKDSTARNSANSAETSATEAKAVADNAQKTANSANSKAASNTTNITKLSEEGIVIAYESTDESIQISKGITLS